MKETFTKILLGIALVLIPKSVLGNNETGIQSSQSTSYGHIDALGLKALLDSKISLDLLDARSDKYFHGEVIPSAKRLPSNSSLEEIKKTIGNKNQLIIVYCAGEGCEASKKLATILIQEGYKNIIDFHGGDREWKNRGFSMTKLSTAPASSDSGSKKQFDFSS